MRWVNVLCLCLGQVSNKPAHIVYNIVPVSTEQIVPLKLRPMYNPAPAILMQVQQCGVVSVPCMREGGLGMRPYLVTM